jgi:hypothetical protein
MDIYMKLNDFGLGQITNVKHNVGHCLFDVITYIKKFNEIKINS